MPIESTETMPESFDLTSWKEIAAASHLSITTAKEFARRAEDPLPVYLFGARKVMATRAEVGAWLRRQLRRPAPSAA